MKVELKELLAKITNTPLVVETGTSGIWTYRKWSDGTAECWCSYSVTLSHYVIWNNFAGFTTDLALPADLFIDRPSVRYSVAVGSGFAIGASNFRITKDSIGLYAMSNATGSQSTIWDVDVKGRWK